MTLKLIKGERNLKTDDNYVNNNMSVNAPAISGEVCSSCRIGVNNLEAFNRDLKKEIELQEKNYSDMQEYESCCSLWEYDTNKIWFRTLRDLKKVKDFIDEGKDFEDVKKFYKEMFK
jgi:hypothetical protein